MSEEREDLVDLEEASRLLEVEPSQVETMVEEGMLASTEGSSGRRFRRSEVMALRELGG